MEHKRNTETPAPEDTTVVSATFTTMNEQRLPKPASSGDRVDVGGLIPLLPWGAIAEYWTMKEIAQTRLVSRAWDRLLCDAVSPAQCAQYLSSKLVRDNLHILTQTTCDKWMSSAIQGVDKLTHMLSRPSPLPAKRVMASPLPSFPDTHQRKRKPSGVRRTHSNSSNITMATSSTGNSIMSIATTSSAETSICRMSTTSLTNVTKDAIGFSPLRMLLHILRIIECVPEQAAVAYNRSYGRHLLPMEWNEEKALMQVVPQQIPNGSGDSPVEKLTETTRRYRIPTIISVDRRAAVAPDEVNDASVLPSNNVDDYFTISANTSESSTSINRIVARNVSADVNKPPTADAKIDGDNKCGNEILDLKHYYNTGVPNLPPRLKCPRCGLDGSKQPTNHSTLVLSELSYKSSRTSASTQGTPENFVASPNQIDLTLSPQTPKINGDGDNVDHSSHTVRSGSGTKDICRITNVSGRKDCQNVKRVMESEDVDLADDDESLEFDSLFPHPPASPKSRKRLKVCEDGSSHTINSSPEHLANRKSQCMFDDSMGGKEANVAIPIFPPPLYCDMAIPHRASPLPYKRDNKHALSIHCSSCNEFGILAPASVCWDQSFPCHQRGLYLSDQQQQDGSAEKAKDESRPKTTPKSALQINENGFDESIDDGSQHQIDPTMIGGILVRTRCSAAGCERPILCGQCHHAIWHEPYGNGGTNWMGVSQSNLASPTIRHSSHCPSCRETYCHEHAWLCTICHHW